MTRAAHALSAALLLALPDAFAQDADPGARLQACSAMDGAARLECLEGVARQGGHTPPGGWVVSRTASAVDYSPVASATIGATGAAGMKLSIRCRGGRTELALTGAGLPPRGAGSVVTYRFGEGTGQSVAAVPVGDGIAFGGDAVRIVQSLPDGGSLDIRVRPQAGVPVEATFPLDGIGAVRTKLAAPCRWPHALAGPNR